MKAWRWFVGQVARLRRSIADAVAPGAERAGDNAASADEPAGGPPAHWVERVRQGAPGLLEPSLRRRGEPAQPPAERAVTSQAELEPRTRPLEERDRSSVPPEPLVEPRQPEAGPRLLQRVLRRQRSVPPANVEESSASTADDDGSPAPTPDRIPRELHAATRHARKTEGSPTREPLERRRLETPEAPAGNPTDRRRRSPVDESEQPPARRSVPTTALAERSPRRSEVVEFEAPAQHQAAEVERHVRPSRADAGRPAAATSSQAELVVEEVGPDRLSEAAVPSPARKRESNVEWLREPAVPTSQREPAREPGPALRRRAEPLAAIEKHPWPELPPPLDEVDGDVEAALRAWAHQQRIDHEQTRL